MGVLGTLREAFEASTRSADRSAGAGEPAGAYWCHDCGERIPAGEAAGEDAPDCPECGDEMEVERSPGSTGCAC